MSKAALVLACILASACRRDMQDQPKYRPLAPSAFFADGRSARPIPAGAIAVDDPVILTPELTGRSNGEFLATLPTPVTEPMLRRGRERFDIFCSPCHGRLGDGNGMIAQRGLLAPMNLQSERVRNAPPGYIFAVITDGYGAMGKYSDQVEAPDRWAIVEYIRALQLSQDATLNEVPPEQHAALEKSK